MPITLSTVLSFVGLALVIPLVVLNLIHLKRRGRRADALLPLGVSVIYSAVIIFRLIQQSHGLSCVLSPTRTLLLYGLPLLFLAYFLFDTIRNFRRMNQTA